MPPRAPSASPANVSPSRSSPRPWSRVPPSSPEASYPECSRRHLTGRHDQYASLRPQRLQPILQQRPHLLLQQHLFNSLLNRVQLRRRHVPLRILRQHGLVVVRLNLRVRDGDPIPKAYLDKIQQLHPQLPSPTEFLWGKAVVAQIFLPPRIRLAMVLLARRYVLPQRRNLSVQILIRDRLFGLQRRLLQNQRPIDQPLNDPLPRERWPRAIRLNLLKPPLLVHIAL